MKKVLLFTLFFSTMILPQELHLTELYRDFIPTGFSKNPQGIKQVEVNLRENLLIHPSLIYYYLEYLNLRITHNIIDPELNFSRTLSDKRNQLGKMKNDFLADQRRQIESKNYPRVKENKMLSCLDEFATQFDKNVGSSQNPEIDKNKQYYFTFIALINQYEKYDSTQDYKSRIQREAVRKIKYFNTAYNNLGNMDKDEKLTLLDETNTYWYFFDPDENFFDEKINFNPADIAEDIYKDDFIISKNFNLGVFYYPVNFVFKDVEKLAISAGYTSVTSEGFERNLQTETNINSKKLFEAFLGYRFGLEKEYGALSYIDFSLGVSYNDIRFDPALNTVFYEQHGVKPGQYIDTQAYIDKKSSSSYSLSTRLMVPIFYLNPVFYVNIGASYTASFNKLDYEVVIEETVTDLQGNKEINNYNQTGNYSKTANVIAAIVSMNASLSNNFDLILEGDFSNYFASGLGLIFRF